MFVMTHSLPNGYNIKNNACSTEYTVQKVLGRGATSIAYLTTVEDGTERILKEYFPIGLELTRNSDGTVNCPMGNLTKYMVCLALMKQS